MHLILSSTPRSKKIREEQKKSVSRPVNRPLLYFFYLLTRWHHSHTLPWIIYGICARKKAKSPIHAWNVGVSCLAGLDRACMCMWHSHNSEALGTALLVEKESKEQKAEGEEGKNEFKKKVKKTDFCQKIIRIWGTIKGESRPFSRLQWRVQKKRWNNKRNVKRRKTNKERQTGKALKKPPCGPIIWAPLQVTVSLNGSAL